MILQILVQSRVFKNTDSIPVSGLQFGRKLSISIYLYLSSQVYGKKDKDQAHIEYVRARCSTRRMIVGTANQIL
jgi:hypothetical protein